MEGVEEQYAHAGTKTSKYGAGSINSHEDGAVKCANKEFL